MVSLLHEGVLKLVRDRPAFAANLLGGLLGVEVPRFTQARVTDVTLSEVPQRGRSSRSARSSGCYTRC
jgi:hypothetical protein